jgi:hypothetical protein
MSFRKVIQSVCFTAWIALAVSSCAVLGGTEAGNPGVTNTAANGPVIQNLPQSLASLQIIDAICTKLTECNPSVTTQSCYQGVEAQTNLTPAFGVSSSFGTFSQVISAETVGTLRADPTRTQTCISQIQAQSCASPTVTTAFSPVNPTVYTGVINMIPTSGTSCAGVF